jgi:hypothetical protein
MGQAPDQNRVIMNAITFKPWEDMAMRAPIVHIQHFLTLFDNIGASAALVQDPEHPQILFVAKSPLEAVAWAKKFLSADEWSQVSGSAVHPGRDSEEKIGADNPSYSSDDDVAVGSRHLGRRRTLRRGRESSGSDGSDDSNVLDPLQNGPEPKRRRIISTKDETHREPSKSQSSRLFIKNRQEKPMSCRSTDDESQGTSTSSRSEFSDADEDDESLDTLECETKNATALPNSLTSPPPETARSTSAETSNTMARSSRSTSPFQCESDYPSHMIALHKEAEAASPKHRTAMIKQSLALGTYKTLEDFREACVYWRSHVSKGSRALALNRPVMSQGPAYTLDQFSHAYHIAQTTKIHQAVVNILYRTDLAHLYDVYLSTLEALSPFSVQPRDTRKCRPRELFDVHARTEVINQMFWACYPNLRGKPRSFSKGLFRKFSTTLEYAAKWHALRERFGIGILALVPRGANSSYETLPFQDIPVYFRLIAIANPFAVNMAEVIGPSVFCFWRREELPKQLLALERLETIDETFFKACPSSLLEGVKEETNSAY